MADDDLTTEAESPQDAPTSKRTATMIIGAGLLIGTLGGLYLVSPRESAATLPSLADTVKRTAKDSAHDAPKPVHMIENLVVNPAETGGTRFLMLAIAVEVENGEADNELKARDSEVRDAVLRVLSNCTVQQLTDLTRRDSLKAQLRTAIAAKFAPGRVGQLYFPQFVIQ